MKLFGNFTSTDRTILGGSLLILLVLSYLLYDDSLLFSRNQHSNQTPVGTLASLENDVRKKSSTDFVWLPGAKRDDIYNQDSIFTGAESRAAIQLADGSVIHIQENSLVNINVKNGQMQLDLRFGQLTGTGKSTIRVKTAADEYTIDGKDGKFEVNRSASGELDVKVLSGKAEVIGKKGRQNLKPNESLQISNKGVEKNEAEASITLVTKNNTLFYRQTGKEPLRFEWSGKGPLAQYQFEVSTEESFKKLLSLKMSAEPTLTLSGPLKEGSYFWRVKGLNSLRKVLVTSPSQTFMVSTLNAPTITSPANNMTLSSVTLETEEGLRSKFKVSWNGEPRHTKYEWQLAKNPDFEELAAEATQTATTVETPNLESGKYFTRVRGFDKEDHPSSWSEVHTVTLNVEGEEKPEAPKLLNLLTRFQIPVTQGRTPSANEVPQLGWTEVEQAKNYHWEIAQNPRFVGAKTLDTEDTKVSWAEYTPGKHYYRVYARSELGQLSNASQTGVIEVFGNQPTLQPIAPMNVRETNPNALPPSQSTQIAWSATPGAASYLLQVDKTPEFTAPQEKELASTQDSLKLTEPGKYFVRVKAQNEMKQDISAFSNIQEANYSFQITLKKPVLIEPLNQTSIVLQKDTEPYIWLEWNPVTSAVRYKLEMSRTPDFAKIIVTKELSETRYLIKNKIPYGKIYWRVSALAQDPAFNGDWSAWWFEIYQQRNQGF